MKINYVFTYMHVCIKTFVLIVNKTFKLHEKYY